ncbi:helix-turn-helix domain-containing protein [Streptomyces sp. NPDC018584]|uniref:helix-turn-helix domain-containing protein n=1 Tax=unclassified Streptomyces TaxID=2593676 RepID=UPI00379BC7CC
MSTSRPLLTQREAAAACGVSRTTIRRRREAGELPGSVQDEKGGWLIPVESLLAAGFRLNAPSPPEETRERDQALPVADRRSASDEAALRAELEKLRAEHTEALTRAAVAEARLEEREARLRERAAHIEDLQRALAALTPAPERAAIPQPSPPAGSPLPVPPAAIKTDDAGQNAGEEGRRRWWPRRR